MDTIGPLIIVLGLACALFGFCSLVLETLGKNPFWTLAFLVLPPSVLVYALFNWHRSKDSVVWYFGGLLTVAWGADIAGIDWPGA